MDAPRGLSGDSEIFLYMGRAAAPAPPTAPPPPTVHLFLHTPWDRKKIAGLGYALAPQVMNCMIHGARITDPDDHVLVLETAPDGAFEASLVFHARARARLRLTSEEIAAFAKERMAAWCSSGGGGGPALSFVFSHRAGCFFPREAAPPPTPAGVLAGAPRVRVGPTWMTTKSFAETP